jgi:hypothetical protein
MFVHYLITFKNLFYKSKSGDVRFKSCAVMNNLYGFNKLQ